MVRAAVGLKKEHDCAVATNQNFKDLFDKVEFTVSLLIGFTAGIIGAVMLYGAEVDRQVLLSLVAAGYGGTDFIEGIMKNYLPTKSKGAAPAPNP